MEIPHEDVLDLQPHIDEQLPVLVDILCSLCYQHGHVKRNCPVLPLEQRNQPGVREGIRQRRRIYLQQHDDIRRRLNKARSRNFKKKRQQKRLQQQRKF